MACQYRVTLSGIKGFYRVYRMGESSTLYAFHKQMRADMECPADQLILFKGLDADGNVVARYGLFDLGDGAADQVTVADTLKKGIVSFVYFYDVTNRKSVNITFEEQTPGPAGAPALTDSKGPDPIDFENGYVAFEDLPADQRHLPSESSEKKKRNPLEDILGALDDLDDEEDDEDDDDDEDEEDERDDDEAVEVYDGTEELTL